MPGGSASRRLSGADHPGGSSDRVDEFPDAAASLPVLASFSGWVWTADPGQTNFTRGASTARLIVRQGSLEVLPGRVGRWARATPHIVYAWPVVVIEHHRPLRDVGILVEVRGKLGRVGIRRGSRGRLRRALESAGFGVVEVTHRTWEAAKPVSAAHLGAAVGQVPPCVVASAGSG